MRVFMTGASGFVGGHVARAFIDRGDQILALSRVLRPNIFGITWAARPMSKPEDWAYALDECEWWSI